MINLSFIAIVKRLDGKRFANGKVENVSPRFEAKYQAENWAYAVMNEKGMTCTIYRSEKPPEISVKETDDLPDIAICVKCGSLGCQDNGGGYCLNDSIDIDKNGSCIDERV